MCEKFAVVYVKGGGGAKKETDGTEKLVEGGGGGEGKEWGVDQEQRTTMPQYSYEPSVYFITTLSIHFSVVNFACKYHSLLWETCFQLSI